MHLHLKYLFSITPLHDGGEAKRVAPPERAASDGVVVEEDGSSSAGVRGALPVWGQPQRGQLTHCQGTVTHN